MEKVKIIDAQFKNGLMHVKMQNGTKEFREKLPIALEWQKKLKNKECQLQRQNGEIVSLILDGQDLLASKSYQGSKQAGIGAQEVRFQANPASKKQEWPVDNEYARSPYNFVPINRTVVGAVVRPGQILPFDRYHEKALTGYIDLMIETKTPLYIRDCNNRIEEAREADNPDFFSPGGQVKIPGSSIRGMTRSLVEIVSWSSMEFIEDKVLYYRSITDKCKRYSNHYRDNISVYNYKDNKTMGFKFDAGYLKKEGLNYYIVPAQKDSAGKQFQQIKQDDTSREFFIKERKDGKWLVVSGKMPGKKRDWIINAPNLQVQAIPVLSADIKAYQNDSNRKKDKREHVLDNEKKDGDLLRMLGVLQKKDHNAMVPCFYVCWRDETGNERVSFGHTGYFRLAYKRSIASHLPEAHKTDIIDMAQAIFGKINFFVGRVYFEDAILLEGQDDILLPATSLAILSGPKPTTFQHYLEQRQNNVSDLQHWDDKVNEKSREGLLRGHKLYWHRDTSDDSNQSSSWDMGEIITDNKQYTVISPVKRGIKFEGRVRFENLTSEELGALLFVLDLPTDKHYHKLGMGKPLGMGSVLIKPKLYLSRRDNKNGQGKGRYQQLFADNGRCWHHAEETAELSVYKEAFAEYILQQLEAVNSPDLSESHAINKEDNKGSAVEKLWKIGRLQELTTMLDWENNSRPNWLDKTRYMEVDQKEFVARKVLPYPSALKRLP